MSNTLNAAPKNEIAGVIYTLTIRELVRFFRQRTRLIGAVGQPLIFWILFGTGLRGSFQPPDWAPPELTYQQYFFPGVTVLILMFTAIFSTISIIEDRREGFLQAVLVAPVSRSGIVCGKLLGGTLLALTQVGLFLVVAPVLHMLNLVPTMIAFDGISAVILTNVLLVMLAFSLTALGYVIAWPMQSTQGFHAIMSIFLMPMWLLSGAFFPAEGAGWLQWVMAANPLTYGVAGLQQLMLPGVRQADGGLPSVAMCLLVTAVFGAICFAISVWLTGRSSVKNVT